MTPSADTPEPLVAWSGRAVLHVDLDAFFAAVEQLDHPAWRGKPVIVGGHPAKRGVVSTASYEARVFGVHSAMPSARAAQLCPDAIWVGGSFDRYREVSAQVFEIFRSEAAAVQPVSIDEAFLDVTPGRYGGDHPIEVAQRIRRRIAAIGITGSVGVATSKTVAKIASDFRKPDSVTVVWPGTEREFLAPLPVRALSGVGPRSAEALERLGIRTLGDLAGLDEATAVAALGSHGPELVKRAQGVDRRPVCANDPVKSVSNERTFATDIREASELDTVTDMLAAKVGQRLRKKGLAGRTVTIKIRFSDFTTRTAQRALPAATDDECIFAPVARMLVHNTWSPGVGVRLLGVGISGFDARAEQLIIADPLDDARAGEGTAEQMSRAHHGDLVRGIDAVRDRFGDDAVRFGRDLMHPDRMRKATETEDE